MSSRYKTIRTLGKGGLGQVLLAQDQKMNREVAIKRLDSSYEDEESRVEAKRQLEQEAASLAKLQHPNIVTVYDYGSDDDGNFIVMEYIKGESLEDIIERGPLPWQDFIELATQTQEALIAAQQMNLMHSDLKPQNIMRTALASGKNQYKIVDFGLASLAHAVKAPETSGVVYASVHFMSPEQCTGKQVTVQSDMYSIGCVYYYALTGELPFQGRDNEEVIGNHLAHHVHPVAKREGIPDWVYEWTLWLINRKAENRPQSAQESLKLFMENIESSATNAAAGDKAEYTSDMPPPSFLSSTKSKNKADKRGGLKIKLPSTLASSAKPAPIAAYKANVINDPKTHREANPLMSQAVRRNPINPPPPVALHAPTPPAQKPNPADPLAADKKIAPPVAHIPTPVTQPIIIPPTKSKQEVSEANANKLAIIIGSCVALIVIGVILAAKMNANPEFEALNKLLVQGEDEQTKVIPINKKTLDVLITELTRPTSDQYKKKVCRVLQLAQMSDNTDFDAAMINVITDPGVAVEIKSLLIAEVMNKRCDPKFASSILTYAAKQKNEKLTLAVLDGIRPIASGEAVLLILDFIGTSQSPEVEQEAVSTATAAIERTPAEQCAGVAGLLWTKIQATTNNKQLRDQLIDLLGYTGRKDMLVILDAMLRGENIDDAKAAIDAMTHWRNPEAYDVFLYFLKDKDKNKNPVIRLRVFAAAYKYLSYGKAFSNPDLLIKKWNTLADQALDQPEQEMSISSIAEYHQIWMLPLLERYKKSDNTNIRVLAETTEKLLRDKNPKLR